MVNPTGRPPLPRARARVNRLSVSFTAAEMERVRAHARRVKLRVAEFVREAVLIVTRPEGRTRR